MVPFWAQTALAGLLIGMAYAWWAHKHAKKQPIRQLNQAAVSEIAALVEQRKLRRAVNLLRAATGLSAIDAHQRIAAWNTDAERDTAA